MVTAACSRSFFLMELNVSFRHGLTGRLYSSESLERFRAGGLAKEMSMMAGPFSRVLELS